jgi:cysteine-S-conjugate beta-lyase
MEEKVIYDFDQEISRQGTFAEKYDARQRIFGKHDVEPFWVADMDLPTPAFLIEAMQQRLQHPMFGYTEQYSAVFDSIAWWMQDQHAAGIEQEWVSLSPSVVTSISNAIQVYTKPGDSVALLSPVYGPFFTCVDINERTVADCPLSVTDGKFEIDFSRLEGILAQPRVKLFLLCNPQNPGGRVWRKDELQKLVDLCTTHDVIIFSDEIHCDVVYPPNRHTSLLNITGAQQIGLVAHSIGKTFNTSGLQASFVIIPNSEMRGRFRNGAERMHAADINLLGKVAMAHALSPQGAEYKRQLIAYLQKNTLLVAEKLKALDIDVMVPEATFLVWSDFRRFGPWKTVFNRLLNDANVALSGGAFFGPAGEGWFRINCAHPRSQLLPAVDRIIAAFL